MTKSNVRLLNRNQSNQTQKAILSLVVKKTAFENECLALQVKCIEMKKVFEKVCIFDQRWLKFLQISS